MYYNKGIEVPPNTEHGININKFLTLVYSAEGSRPRKVKNNSTLEMADNAIIKLNSIKSKINTEITYYNLDLKKCNDLLYYLSQIDSKMSITSSNILTSQNLLKNSFILTDGTVPGLNKHQESSKNLLEVIDIRSSLKTTLNNEIKEINCSIKNLNQCISNTNEIINDIRREINQYYLSLKNKQN